MSEPDTHRRDTPLEQRTRALFERSVADLDPSIAARLARARNAALGASDASPRTRSWGLLLAPAAFAAVIAIVLLRPERERAPVPTAAFAAEDMAILLDEDGMEFLAELEFYAWLAHDSAAL